MDSEEEEITARISKLIDVLSKLLPDPIRASSDLWTFAKKHDRRNYQLIRFCMAADSDYHTVYKAIKELTKRVQSSSPGLLDTLTPLLYRSSLLVYNKSHVPAIMELSRSDDQESAVAAHELLAEISSRTPEVLKAHVHAICKDLEQEAPSAKKQDGADVDDTVKACAGFAKKFPAEIPKDRKFLVAMTNFALYSNSPRAAKHAVSILISVSGKRDIYAKDLIQKCTKDWKYGSSHFLPRLATLAQLSLLTPDQAVEESDAIVSIAVDKILLNGRSSTPDAGYVWSEQVDEETSAKELALKIIVNRIRSWQDAESLKEQAAPVFQILTTLVTNEGELSKKRDTPAAQKSRLRLMAANLILKLCSKSRTLDDFCTGQNFNSISFVAQDPLIEVRSGFISKLKKYLGLNKLGNRWYTIAFLLAYEPFSNLKDSTLTWIRARASFFSRQAKTQQSTVMESVFARLLSLLAHHPDYSHDDTDDLVDFARYILFYLSAVANERNISFIFHIAQRIKQLRDAVSQDANTADVISENLYHLSDLSQATIRKFHDFHDNWAQMQTWPGKVKLPNTLFAPLPNHDVAQEIADKNYLPEDVEDTIEKMVKSTLRPKSGHSGGVRKRKMESTGGDATAAKKVKKEKALPIRRPNKTPRKKSSVSDEIPSSERRRSGRAAPGVSYKEEDSEEDDAEMEEWDAKANESDEVDAQGGVEASSEVEVEEEEADPEVEEKQPVKMNGKAAEGKENKTSVSRGKKASPLSSPKAKAKAKEQAASAPVLASRTRRTRAAAAAGGDKMEE
jgi:sister chromatid cohesion protein PDS5